MTDDTETLERIIKAPETLPAIIKAREEADAAAAMYAGYEVTSMDTWQAAAEDLTIVKRKLDEVAELSTWILSPLKEHTARLQTLLAVPRDRLMQAKGAIERPMLEYQDRVKREREEATRKAHEAARAEHARKTEEAAAIAARAAAERAAAERAAMLAQNETDKALAERALQQADDREQAASEALHAAEAAPLVVSTSAIPEMPKAKGTQTRERWHGKPENDDAPAALAKLVRAAAADPSLIGFLALNQTAINQIASQLKSHARLPGFVFAPVTSIASARK